LAGETKMVGLLYGCTERHAFGCILNLCGRAWHFSFLRSKYTCLFRQCLP
jgi:hypothetical protein